MAEKKIHRRRLRSAPIQKPLPTWPVDLRARVKAIVNDATPKVLSLLRESGVPSDGREFRTLEEQLLRTCASKFVGPLIEEVLRAVHADEGFVTWCMADAQRRCPAPLKATGDLTIPVKVAGGRDFKVKTPYMVPPPPPKDAPKSKKKGKRGKDGVGLYPVLAMLGFLARVSPYVSSGCARVSCELDSYEEGVRSMAREGLELNDNYLRRVVDRVGDAGLAAREAGSWKVSTSLAGKRVVVTLDGGRVRYRIEKGGRRRKSGHHGYEAPWREPKVFAIYVVDENGKKTSERSIYEGTLAPWDDAIELAASVLKAHGGDQAKVLAIAADGSSNIWDRVDRLVELLGIDRSKVVEFVDYYHAAEYVYGIARLLAPALDWSDQARDAWARKQKKRLKGGRVKAAIRQSERVLEEATQLTPDDRETVEKKINYLRKRVDRMRYNELTSKGLPIGTGAVESAIRRVVNLRLKSNGTFWRPENAERMLYLRCRLKAGRWEEVEEAIYQAALLPKQFAPTPAVLDRVAA